MRAFLIVLFTAVILKAQIADTVFVSADSLNNSRISLSGNWKFKSGDNIKWAQKTFNDSSWLSINPQFPKEDSLVNLWKGIGWFRKVIKIDSSLLNQSILIQVTHYGASEIYLNGNLIHKYGKVSEFADSEKCYIPQGIPIMLTFSDVSENVLAVRYSNHKVLTNKEEFFKWHQFAGFNISLRNVNKTIALWINSSRTNFGVNFGIAGLFLSLAILYFILFVFYSKRKENLFYSLFAFGLGLILVMEMFGMFVYSSIATLTLFKQIAIVSLSLVFLSFVGFLYSIFYERFPKFFLITLAYAVIFSICVFSSVSESLLNILLVGFVVLCVIEGIRVIWYAFRKRKPNVKVIGTGVLVFIAFLIVIVGSEVFSIHINNLVRLTLFILGLFSVPSSMSVYLARNIALTNKNLQQQLETVKELSQKEIEIEKKNAELKVLAERERAENERKTIELEEARQLQLSLLPKVLPELPHLDIAVYMQTATEVGGDYYDFHVGVDGTLTVAAGDATGHGLNAGTMVTATKSLFSTHAENPDILSTFTEMSRCIKDLNFKLLSMCLMILKVQRNKLIMSSAGMPPALLYRQKTNTIEEIVLRGMPLGTATAFPYKIFETEFEKGDTLLLMSDGFPELFNDNMEMFGYHRTSDEFLKLANKAPDEIIDGLKKKVTSWVGNKAPQDDVTFVVLKAN